MRKRKQKCEKKEGEMWKKQLRRHQGQGRRGVGALDTGPEIPLQPMERYNWADIHTAAHGGPYAGPCGYLVKELWTIESPCQSWWNMCEGLAEKNCNGLTTTPFHISLCCSEVGKRCGVKLRLGRRKVALRLLFIFVSHHPMSISSISFLSFE